MGFRTTQKRRGGAFVAKGSYGCVFKKPPLKCKDNATRKNNSYISKLSSKNTADEEYAQSLVLRYYDPREQYFVTAESSCALNNSNIKPENGLSSCTLNTIKKAIKNKNYSNAHLVLYKNAGTDLHRLPLAVEDYIPFYESIINLFNALKFIHSKGILHRDLKSDNVISQKNSDGSFTTRLIDVGFMCPLKPLEGEPSEMLIEQQRFFAKQCTFWYGNKKARSYGPFYEYLFAEASSGKESRIQEYQEGKDFSTVYENWVEDVSKYIGSNDPFKNEDDTPRYRYSDVMDALVEVWGEKAMQEFSTSTGPQSTGPAFVLELGSKADVFCLGLLLSKVQRRYVEHKVDREGGAMKTFVPRSTLLKNAGAPEIWVDVEELATYGVPSEEAAWHIAVANRISKPLHTLMIRMSNLDPRRAIDLNEAVREYSEILPAIRELYTPANVYKALKAIDAFPDLAAPVAGVSSKPAAVAKAKTPSTKPTSTKPTSTRKLRLEGENKKALDKKKKALDKAKKEAKEELEEAQEEVSDARRKIRDLEGKLDAAKRDKMAPKVIADFEKVLGKYTKVLEKAVLNLEEVRDEGRATVEAKQRAYNEFRAALPRLSK